MIKTCALCGKEFEVHGRGSKAKYCPTCRADTGARQRMYYRNHRDKLLAYQKAYQKAYRDKQREMQRTTLKPLKACEVCGKDFEVRTNAKYCPDCRAETYKKNCREYLRLRRKAQRVEKPAVKPVEKAVVKPKNDPKKQRLAYLRRCFEQAQTPEVRSRYFRQYVLLKQEVLRGT